MVAIIYTFVKYKITQYQAKLQQQQQQQQQHQNS